MKLLIAVLALICAVIADDVRLLDLDPPEAQQIIESKDQTLKYAPKIETSVPAVRYLGNEPHNVLEDIYLANQYHGQDGIGGYLYGYSVPDIAKTEKKKAGGDLRGAYNYVNGQGQEIKVEYWDDGTGFHQVDNVPKILPVQIPDTPEVQAAKEEHARLWKEQALRNSKPIESPFDGNQYKPEFAAQIGAQVKTPGLPGFPTQHPQGSYQSGQTNFQGQSGQAHQQGQQQGHQQGQYQGQFQQGQYQQGQQQPQHQISQFQQSQSTSQYQPGQSGQYQGQGQTGQFQQSGQYQQPNQFQQQGQQPNQFQQGQYQQPKPNQFQQGNYQGSGAFQKPGANVGLEGGDINNVEYTGQYTEPKGAFVKPPGSTKQEEEEEEVTGPPKGFFYNFDYPVGIIVSDQGRALPAGSHDAVHKRESITDVYNKNKEFLEKQLKEGAILPSSSYPQYLVTS